MRQSRLESIVEAVANTAIGFVISFFAQIVICWAYNIQMSHAQNAILVGWMTVVSVARSYVVRRIWERRLVKRIARGN